MLHTMNLTDLPFRQIKEGIKLIEARLFDEKRRLLNVGDTIEFTNTLTKEKIVKEIVGLEHYSSFEDLFLEYDFILFGGRGYTLDQMINCMYQFYDKEKEKKYGVLGIVLKDDYAHLREKLVIRSYPFEGHLIHLRNDLIKMPNNHETVREWIEHPGASAVVVVDNKNNIYLEKQYRYPLGKVMIEIPAGKLNDIEESPADCAIRELQEETGIIAEEIHYLGSIHLAIAYSNEVIHLYYVNNFKKGKRKLDEDEFVDIYKIPFIKAYEMVLNGEITDSKTVSAILLYKNKIFEKI